MIAHWAGIVWEKLPYRIRSLIVRTTQTRFTASAAAVVVNGEGKVLLLEHRIRPRSGWGLPGGFLKDAEQPADGVCREILEETGLELKGLKLLSVRTLRKHIELLYFARSNGTPQIRSREIKTAGWFAAGQLPGEMDRRQQAFISEVLGRAFEKDVSAD